MEDKFTRKLIKLYRRTGSLKAREILVNNHQNALYLAAKSTPNNIFSIGDKVQMGNLFLIELISNKYDLRRKMKFNSYLITYAKHRIIDEMRRYSGMHKGKMIRSEEVYDNISVNSAEESIENKELLKKLEESIAELPYTEQVIMGCLHQGMKITEIAKQAGCTVSYISQIVNKAKKKLKISLDA